MVFPLNKPLGDKSRYYRRRWEDESRYLAARKGYWILEPHQCEKHWFINLCGCCPDLISLADIQTLGVLHRSNLVIFWRRHTSKIHGIFGYAKELMIISREAYRADPLPAITAWPVGDEVGMGVAIQMLDKSLSNRRNGRN